MTSIGLVMIAVILVGAALSFLQGIQRVEVETGAALAHARRSIAATLSSEAKEDFRPIDASQLLRSFDESRHLRAFLVGPLGIYEASTVKEPDDPAPLWFSTRMAPAEQTVLIDLPASYRPAVALRLQTDPRGEIAELWDELKLDVALLAGLAGCVLVAVRLSVARALSPLSRIVASIESIGRGDYSPRVPLEGVSELDRISAACNVMAQKLSSMDHDNRCLHEELLRVQEEERADLARDLHDVIGPQLFAVDVDAMAIAEHAAETGEADVSKRAEAIRASAGEVKAHVSTLLAKLRPQVTFDLGLGNTVAQLVSACQLRHPNIKISSDVPAEGWGRDINAAIYYVIRESLNNALRHSGASRITISAAARGDGAIEVAVRDNGSGLPASPARTGYGMLGMKERMAAIGGKLVVKHNPDGPGTTVEARISLPEPRPRPQPEANGIYLR